MKRTALLILMAVLSLSTVQAQERYFGVGASVLTNFVDGVFPLLSLQLGGSVADKLELRGTLETLLLISNAGVDLLYTFPVAEEVRGYAGGGADLFFIVLPGVTADLAPGAHGTVGLEYPTGNVRFYSEIQLYLLLALPVPIPKFRAGVNFYF